MNEDLQKAKELLVKLKKMSKLNQQYDEYLPIEEGEIAISQELKAAIARLIEVQYRGITQWKVVTVHRFNERGVQVRTSIRADGGNYLIEFTEFEVIAIAKVATAKSDEKD